MSGGSRVATVSRSPAIRGPLGMNAVASGPRGQNNT